jgi:hypothetical protein
MVSSPLWPPYPQLGPEQSVSLLAKLVKIKIGYMDLFYVGVELETRKNKNIGRGC